MTEAGQNNNDGAEEIEGALDWIRVHNKFVDSFRGGDDVLFGKLNSVPVSQHSPEERKKDMEDILDWIRSKKDDSKDPTGVFKKVDQLLPEKPSWKIEHMRLNSVRVSQRSPEERKKDVEDILDWIPSKKEG